MKNKLDEWQRG